MEPPLFSGSSRCESGTVFVVDRKPGIERMAALCGRFGPMRGVPEILTLPGGLLSQCADDLFPVWCLVDSLEQAGEMAAEDAVRWKHGIYGLMMLWGLEPDELFCKI